MKRVLVTPAFVLPFIACIFFLKTTVSAPAQDLTLLTNAFVDSEGVFLSQIVRSAAPLPHVRLCNAPQFGQATTLTRGQLSEALQKSSVELNSTNLEGADKVRIARRARPYNESEIKDQLTALLQNDHLKDKGELEVRFMRPWVPIVLPDEPLTLKVLNLPSTGVTPNCIVRFELSTKREILGAWQAPISARVWREVWVAKSPLRKDQMLSEADLVRERRDVLTLRESVLTGLPESSSEIAENIQAGSPLYQRSVRPRPVVFRGQLVEAQVLNGPMAISLKVEVLENGAPGQVVRLRNLQSRREFRGQVKPDQTVLVAL
ncbi:MAG TPA: flagellar basal body P-ring formation chaperone FlgA [Candidatus Saccharimonadales bacterium]|nr:flagellar basal body P-ring formation chaperone FlgA [Candidatus Saccharimonadales bacterium]